MVDSTYITIAGISLTQWWIICLISISLIINYIIYKNPELKKFRKKIGFVFAVYGIGLFIFLILAAGFPGDMIELIVKILTALFAIVYIIIFIYMIVKWVKLHKHKKRLKK